MGAEDWAKTLINTMSNLSSLPEPKDRLGYAADISWRLANVSGALNYAIRRLHVSDLASHIGEDQLKTMYDFYKGQLLKYIENYNDMSKEMEKMGGDKRYVEHAINLNKKLKENIEKQTPADSSGYVNESLKNLNQIIAGVNNWHGFLSSTMKANALADDACKKFYESIKPLAAELFEFELDVTEKYDDKYTVPDAQQAAPQAAIEKSDNSGMFA